LTEVIEEYGGSDHLVWSQIKAVFDVDIPGARTENPSRYFCNHCGKRLTKKQERWVAENKAA